MNKILFAILLAFSCPVLGAGTAPRIDTLETFAAPNYVINGGLDIWQRATTSSSASNGYNTADRFYTGMDCTSPTTARDTDVPTNGLSRYSLSFSSSTCASGNRVYIEHKMEGANAYYLGGKTVTLSFWYKATLPNIDTNVSNTWAGFEIPSVADDFTGNDSFLKVAPALTADGTWRKFTYSVSMPKTSPNNSYPITNGLGFVLRLAHGSSTDAWSFKITQFALHEGANAMLFKRVGVSIGAEFALCQRYYEAGSFSISSYATAAQSNWVTIPYAVEKRTAATPTITSTGSSQQNISTLTVYSQTTKKWDATVGPTGTGYYRTLDMTWNVSAEL